MSSAALRIVRRTTPSRLVQVGCRLLIVAAMAVGVPSLAPAGPNANDGPDDNRSETVRPIPPVGKPQEAATLERLRQASIELATRLAHFRETGAAELRPLWTDVEIFRRAVRIAVDQDGFFGDQDVAAAERMLAEGAKRLDQLERGEAPWTRASGLIVRGYVSQLDDSVQPYGLVIPAGWSPDATGTMPLDLWFHGRGETLGELQFLDQRMTQPGQFAPAEAIVLHPYGRYCNANKFAGEVDVFEALDSVRSRYRIDDDRIAVRGFSMGGASAWHLAVHDPGRWAAANPGAGFSETPEFLQTFQGETLRPYWWERRLWRWYDATDWASNLRHVPTVAYSGEKDRQIQAADAMSRAAAAEGLGLVHLIGPDTGHSYHPATAVETERRVRRLVELGRRRVPREIDFVTYTLRYARMGWIEVQGLAEHWERGRVRGRLSDGAIELEVEGITALDLIFEPGTFPFVSEPEIRVRHRRQDRTIESVITFGDGSLPTTTLLATDRSWHCRLVAGESGWRLRTDADEIGLRKRPGLQGPIDDALMGSFLFVEPTGTSPHAEADRWARSEMERAAIQWQRHFRGVVRHVRDFEVTDQMIAQHHLILWGDSSSNKVWERLSDRLPIRSDGDAWIVGDRRFDAATHAPIFVYPNPEAPNRYVVANSSFTFREYAYLNNARQVPVLPDWAIVALDEPAGFVYPGRIAAADFFDETWQLKLPIPEPVRVEADPPFVDPAARQGSKSVEPAVVPSEASSCGDDPIETPRESLDDRRSLGEPVEGAARPPRDEADERFWLENAIVRHGFSIDEVRAATGLSVERIREVADREGFVPFGSADRNAGDPLTVMPYPGGRHPRIGFLDGAVRPQRETKLSVFAPWDRRSYVVCDFPEAIWSDLGLTYLAHTHIDTIWSRDGIELEPQEWRRTSDATWLTERTLPDGLKFGTEALALEDQVAFRMWLINGSDSPRSDLRVQNCVMLKGADGFDQQNDDNKIYRGRLCACGDPTRRRWVIVGWEPIDRAWGNPPCPCLHADPKFPDCEPGARQELFGRVSFYEGDAIEEELQRIERLDWREPWTSLPQRD
ncbi:MAG TPA: prolyl oligopeptidase family serine peptidase [Pirellulaceae bacterium]|nr:prolyl oligopeptidase family serine peptidase [Pirellulaceae bacterium]